MKLSLITPTRHRPQSFQRLCKYLDRQTYKGELEHIVVCSGGAETYNFRPEQIVIERNPQTNRYHDVMENYLAGYRRSSGDVIFHVEDDEWYSEDFLLALMTYFEAPLGGMPTNDLVGIKNVRYYNVAQRTYTGPGNSDWSPLATTAFSRKILGDVELMARSSDPFLDLRAWRWVQPRRWRPDDKNCFAHLIDRQDLFVGIKGCVEGPAGVGVWHRSPPHSRPDPKGEVLRSWIGDEDADAYLGPRLT